MASQVAVRPIACQRHWKLVRSDLPRLSVILDDIPAPGTAVANATHFSSIPMRKYMPTVRRHIEEGNVFCQFLPRVKYVKEIVCALFVYSRSHQCSDVN